MAKRTAGKATGGSVVRRQGRRVMPALRRTAKRARVAAQKAQLTVGEVIAAAFDTAGGEMSGVLELVTSPQMTRALGRRIVVEG
jgi:molybdenum-dependent DNA-binding transcriptional regulator ModE